MRKILAGFFWAVGLLVILSGAYGMFRSCVNSDALNPPRIPETAEFWFSLVYGLVGLCVWSGCHEYLKKRSRTTRDCALKALHMLRSHGQIDAVELAKVCQNYDEISVRLEIARLKRRGIIPHDAKVV